ncbi:hypothetical protein J6590_055447 [Homalodisca vitripennis]|nr:hypothetical protein J6590_055447 [Homalodisca vitripennis]
MSRGGIPALYHPCYMGQEQFRRYRCCCPSSPCCNPISIADVSHSLSGGESYTTPLGLRKIYTQDLRSTKGPSSYLESSVFVQNGVRTH